MPTSMHLRYRQNLHRERFGPVISQSSVLRHLNVLMSSVVHRMKNVWKKKDFLRTWDMVNTREMGRIRMNEENHASSLFTCIDVCTCDTLDEERLEKRKEI